MEYAESKPPPRTARRVEIPLFEQLSEIAFYLIQKFFAAEPSKKPDRISGRLRVHQLKGIVIDRNGKTACPPIYLTNVNVIYLFHIC